MNEKYSKIKNYLVRDWWKSSVKILIIPSIIIKGGTKNGNKKLVLWLKNYQMGFVTFSVTSEDGSELEVLRWLNFTYADYPLLRGYYLIGVICLGDSGICVLKKRSTFLINGFTMRWSLIMYLPLYLYVSISSISISSSIWFDFLIYFFFYFFTLSSLLHFLWLEA